MRIFSTRLNAFIFTIASGFYTCSSDYEPIPVNEEEVLTTMTITLNQQDGGGPPVILQTRDLDGDGPNAPVVTVTGPLASDQVYNGVIELLNETVFPPENITEEVEEEDEEHQYFFLTAGDLDVDTEYQDSDENGHPVGLFFTLSTGDASSGTFTVVLRHLPDKGASGVSDGDITNAGGETDIDQDFLIQVQ